jgi:hypothetical protein
MEALKHRRMKAWEIKKRELDGDRGEEDSTG